MDLSTSQDDLDLIDIAHLDLIDMAGWNPNEDNLSYTHSENDNFNISSAPPQEQAYYYEMNNNNSNSNADNDVITTVRTSSGNNALPGGQPPTISNIYEPKFLEIFNTYAKFASSYEPNLDLSNPASQHLMTLCLNNLLPFSNWARETTTSSYIRATLFENPDMRPEVRNGLALILGELNFLLH